MKIDLGRVYKWKKSSAVNFVPEKTVRHSIERAERAREMAEPANNHTAFFMRSFMAWSG